MSGSLARGVARRSAVFAAVLALSATTCFTAYAQEEDPAAPSTPVTAPSTPVTTPSTPAESTPPVEPSTPTEPSTPVAPSTSAEPAAPPVADEPKDKPADNQQDDPAARSDVQATAEIGAAPPLVGEFVQVELTITNKGPAEAIGVAAWLEHISGSYFSIDADGWDGLEPPWSGPTALTLAAGESRTFVLEGRFFNYQGTSTFRLRVNATNDVNSHDGSPTVQMAVREPVKAGKISGILWGDANGNGVQDAGEGLVGAEAYLYGGGNPNETPRTRTDANGRFTFTELELRTWGLGFSELPGGWVVEYISEQIPVVGGDTTSELRYQAVRPLQDQLTASVRFVSTDHVDDGPVTVEFTLTNKGGADISDVVAGCGRSGEGPHIDIWDSLGELSWDQGATIPAGQSRVFTVNGTISANASSYGYSYVACDFGPEDGIIHGYPGVFDYVKVGEKRTNTNGSIYVDRNGNGWMDSDGEHLTGVSISLADPKTGAVVATATGTGENGEAYFNDIPTGLYAIVVNGPWKVKHPDLLITAADCSQWCQTGWTVEVVPTEEPGGVPGGAEPEIQKPAKVLPVSNYKATAGALAETGASVSGLGLVGALTLLLGGASVFLARRRTA